MITKEKRERKPHSFSYRLTVPGNIRKDGIKIDAKVLTHLPLSKLREKNPYQAYLDYDKIGGVLKVRSRKNGDRFYPLGMKGSKKLQDIFVDEKIDIDDRDSVPIIDDGKKIVWVVGYRISEEAKVTPETRKIVKLTADNKNTLGACD